jgi:hypothetical protein
MKSSGSRLSFLVILFLAFGITTPAADLGEIQLVAARATTNVTDGIKYVCFVTADGYICIPHGAELPPGKPQASVSQVNCLLAVGASMKQNNPKDAAQGFDPLGIVYFGRTTCNRPVPNLNDNPGGTGVRFIVGADVPVTMSGQAVLNYFDPANPTARLPVNHGLDARNMLAAPYSETSVAPYNMQTTDNWGLSRGLFYRTLNTNDLDNSYVITHGVRLDLPTGWLWVSVPPQCGGNLTRTVVCNQESLPFQIGLNPGEPMPTP